MKRPRGRLEAPGKARRTQTSMLKIKEPARRDIQSAVLTCLLCLLAGHADSINQRCSYNNNNNSSSSNIANDNITNDKRPQPASVLRPSSLAVSLVLAACRPSFF
ncbi:hypothetical protein TESG_08486 [Trichophyton tonsurans CBS 112818]|uniref:Uncharacterized protein n=1 Tax=Trichophyton tonsurans (strain CBS 112818) TaxID=647933 RepID=F2S0W9_TRIT1|nr:hypothetical protein TESG_08486 [Trichophyton tonsurans CBS 112818]